MSLGLWAPDDGALLPIRIARTDHISRRRRGKGLRSRFYVARRMYTFSSNPTPMKSAMRALPP
jgi:hypothetical protein